MKNLMIILMLFSTMIFTACGQKDNVPTKVKAAFTKKFPDAKNLRWGKESATEWEAEFKLNGQDYSANFTSDGSWKETEYRIQKSDLPEAVQTTLSENYNDYNIEIAEVSETAKGKVFEILLKNGDKKTEAVIYSNGQMVKQQVEENEEADKADNNEENYEVESTEANNPPEKAVIAFNLKFPRAKKVSWDKENATEWEAEFKMDGKEYSANFKANGTWMETEYKIKKSEIPVAVKQTLNTQFAGYDIEKAEVSEKSDGTVYEIHLEKGDTETEVAILLDGKVVKKESKNETAEEGDNEDEEGPDND
jgi:sulfur carrier protein ThiS